MSVTSDNMSGRTLVMVAGLALAAGDLLRNQVGGAICGRPYRVELNAGGHWDQDHLGRGVLRCPEWRVVAAL